MTTEIINDLIPIPCTDREKLMQLRSLLIEIQSTWFDNLFDSGLTFADPIVWEKMQQAVCLMERRDNPSAKGFDLKSIASDYKLLEQIFISKRWRYDENDDKVYLDSDDFKGADLIQIHAFSPVGILKKVEQHYQSVLLARQKNLTLDELKEKLIEEINDNNLGGALMLLVKNLQDTAYEITSKGIIDDE